MNALVLWLTLATLPPDPRERAVCTSACAKYVTDPKQHARVCQRCPLDEDVAQWVLRLPGPLLALWLDDAWEVRFASLQLAARAGGPSAESRLAGLIASSDQRERACTTAFHVAGQRKQSLSSFLAATGDPAARTACLPLVATIVEAAQVDLFAREARARHQALHHLAAATDTSAARIVLDVLKARPKQYADVPARLLVDEYETTGVPAGLALLREATEQDTESVNRLLSEYAHTRDVNRARLAAKDEGVQLEALHALAAIAPLSQSELEEALTTLSPTLRLTAARALAAGEGRSLAEAADLRLSAVDSPTAATWVKVLGESQALGCEAMAVKALGRQQPVAVRAAGVGAFAACAPVERVMPVLSEAAASSESALRVAAIGSSFVLRPGLNGAALIRAGLSDAAPQVVIAALEGARAVRLRAQLPRVTELAGDPRPEVKTAAFRALFELDAPRAERLARACLEKDSEAAMREACAALLAGSSGGPATIAALVKASKNDSEPHVKFVASETLRRLGFEQPRSTNP